MDEFLLLTGFMLFKIRILPLNKREKAISMLPGLA
jgi:hypothetical protein